MINVHAWGGLAGQLSALATAIWIKRNLEREPRYVFHEGGVTRRSFAVQPLLQGIPLKVLKEHYEFEEDGAAFHSPTLRARLYSRMRRVSTEWGVRVGTVIVRDDLDEQALRGLSRRVRSVIGYPSDWSIMLFARKDLSERLDFAGLPNFLLGGASQSSIAIHWRIGDYLLSEGARSTHGLVSPHDLKAALAQFPRDLPVHLYSDSPSIALNRMSMIPDLARRVSLMREDNIWRALHGMSRSRYFVGTNSGVSMWAAMSVDVSGGVVSLPAIQYRSAKSVATPTAHLDHVQKYATELTWDSGLSPGEAGGIND